MTVAEQIAALRIKIGVLEDQILTLEAEIEFLERPPVPVEPLPLEITVHADTVPVPGGLNVHAVKNGLWNDPAAWSTGKVPTAEDRVRVPAGRQILINDDCKCDVLVVDGEVQINHAFATLTLSTLFGMPTGVFGCGEVDFPFQDPFTLTFRPAPPDPRDPLRFWGGLVWLGEWVMHGKAKTAHSTLMDNAVPAGWAAGDELIFPDTRTLASKDRAAGYNQIERRAIKIVEGGAILLETPLMFNHDGAKNDDGVVDFLPAIANLTRNLVIRAEVPGTAHAIWMAPSKVDMRYVAFQGMGRTTNAPLDAKNLIARYPCHFHHAHHHPFHLEGVVVDGGAVPHNRKWGIVGHGSFGVIRDCVVVNTMGAGIMLEDGSETIRVERNCVIGVGGIGGRVDSNIGGHGRQGTGIYATGPFSEIVDNFVANVHTVQPYSYAYALSFFRLGQVKPVGLSFPENGNGGGHLVFRGNVAFACQSGLVPWWVGYGSPVPADPWETEIELTSVNHYLYGIFVYPCQNVRYELKARGDGTALGIYAADYVANDVVYVPDIQGQRNGILVSTMGGPQTITDGQIRAKEAAVILTTPWTSSVDARRVGPREVVLDGTVLEAPTLIDRRYQLNGTRNLTALDTLTVKNFQGKVGDDFKVYTAEQAPGFIMPKSIPNANYPKFSRILACPEAGLTNAAALKKHGVCVSGELAPVGAKARSGIKGLVAT